MSNSILPGQFIILLSGKANDIGIQECRSLTDEDELCYENQLAVFSSCPHLIPAYGKSCYQFICRLTDKLDVSCEDDLIACDLDQPYAIMVPMAFDNGIVSKGSENDMKKIASNVWHVLSNGRKNPQIDLKNPNTRLVPLVIDQEWYLTKLVWENNEKYEDRRPHLMLAPHPASVHPRLGRAMVHFAGDGPILDPFCGAGGILIEAALLGMECYGFDIDKIMVRRATINISEVVKKGNWAITEQDALSAEPMDATIVTDIPYGKSTIVSDVTGLVEQLLDCAPTIRDKMIVAFPSTLNVKPLIEKSEWRSKWIGEYFHHRTLSKHIHILVR